MASPQILASDRLTTWTAVATAGPFNVDFPCFDGVGAGLSVTLNGVVQTDWTFAGTLIAGFFGAPNTWVNGTITFASPRSGTVVIKGLMEIKRESQYQDGRGVPARDSNFEWNKLTAIAQEHARDIGDLDQRAILVKDGQAAPTIDLLQFAGKIFGFDGGGLAVPVSPNLLPNAINAINILDSSALSRTIITSTTADQMRAAMLAARRITPAIMRRLSVQPRLAATAADERLFRTVAEARQWCIDNPPTGAPYQPTHIELEPANHGSSTIFMVPGMVVQGSSRETAVFEDSALGSLIDISSGFCVIRDVTVWGNNNPTVYTVFGNNAVGVHFGIDLLSDKPPGGDAESVGLRKSLGYFIQGNFQTILVGAGIWDFDHQTAVPPCVANGVNQESDFQHGVDGRLFVDALHMVNGAIFKFNRVRGIVFWQATVRGSTPAGNSVGGINTTPFELTHLLPDNVTLDTGETFILLEGGLYFGAALRVGERCRVIVNFGTEWPGLSADSRGVAQLTKEDGRVVVRPGPARFSWRNAGGNAFTALTNMEARAGKLTIYANGRAGGSVLLHLYEDLVSTIPATNRQVVAGLERAQPLNRVGHRTGIYLRQDSLANRHIFFGTRDGTRLVIERGLSDTTIDGLPLFDGAMTASEFRLRILEFGGNRFYDIAMNGGDFSPVFVESSTAYLTFDRTGLAIDGECIGGTFRPQAQITLDDWYVGV
jgi:hypothetical protein